MLYAAAAIFGIIAGLIMKKLTSRMIEKRILTQFASLKPSKNHTVLIWMLLIASLWIFSVLIGGMTPGSIRLALVGTLCLSLSAVDLKIRKIPNELLLSLLIIQVIYLAVSWNLRNVFTSLIGFAAGLAIFMLPALIGRTAGLGDVKFAAVTGFILGLQGLVAALIIMSALIIGYTFILFATKKGGLKTNLAFGPYLTAGAVAVMALSVVVNVDFINLTQLFV